MRETQSPSELPLFPTTDLSGTLAAPLPKRSSRNWHRICAPRMMSSTVGSSRGLPSTGCNNCRARKVKVCHPTILLFWRLTARKVRRGTPGLRALREDGRQGLRVPRPVRARVARPDRLCQRPRQQDVAQARQGEGGRRRRRRRRREPAGPAGPASRGRAATRGWLPERQ